MLLHCPVKYLPFPTHSSATTNGPVFLSATLYMHSLCVARCQSDLCHSKQVLSVWLSRLTENAGVKMIKNKGEENTGEHIMESQMRCWSFINHHSYRTASTQALKVSQEREQIRMCDLCVTKKWALWSHVHPLLLSVANQFQCRFQRNSSLNIVLNVCKTLQSASSRQERQRHQTTNDGLHFFLIFVCISLADIIYIYIHSEPEKTWQYIFDYNFS